MREYIVDFGDKSSAFVGLAMAEAVNHGANIQCELVRCRECKYFEAEFTEYDPRPWCNALDNFVKPDFYCAWGMSS